jgi:hypothetical protein
MPNDPKVTQQGASEHPMHERLALIKDQSQVCGEFLDWLLAKGYVLAKYHECTSDCESVCWLVNRLYPMNPSIPDLLAEFFEIDRRKLEEEKRQMLETVRARAGVVKADLY